MTANHDMTGVVAALLTWLVCNVGGGRRMATSAGSNRTGRGSVLIAASLLFASVGRAQVELQKGLLGHWTFDGDRGTAAIDSSGAARNGTISGVTAVGEGAGKALGFAGNGCVDFGDPGDGSFDFGADRDLSLSLWLHVSTPPSDQYGLVGKGDRGTNPKLLLKVMPTETILFRIAAGKHAVDVNGKTDVVDGQWHHIAAVADRDGGTRLYVDGKLDGEAEATDTIDISNDSPLVLGKSHQKGAGSRRFLHGYLDDVRLYNRVLTEAEVAELNGMRGQRINVEAIVVPEPRRPAKWQFVRPYETASPVEIERLLDHGQGEMTGEVTSTSAILQSRLTWGYKLIHGDLPGCPGVACFEIAESASFDAARRTEWQEAVSARDFIVKTTVSGLRPGTRYHYRLLYGSSRDKVKQGRVCTFRTLAGPERETEVSFVVVTGMNYHHFHYGRANRPQSAYQGDDRELGYPALVSILKLEPDFVVATGDNVYYDCGPVARSQPELRAKWHEQFVQPRFADLFASVPTYWEKDDHDHRYNDCDTEGAREPSSELGIATFIEQVPVVDARANTPRTYRTHRVSRDLQIWLAEGRDYRSRNAMPDGPDKTLWGAAQIQWLKRTLLASDAAFKILVSPTPIIGPDRSSKRDNHSNPDGFHHEGRQFIAWLRDNGFLNRNIYFACGDRHWQYHSVDPSGFEEFSCGALVDANAIGGTFPGDSGSNDPEGEIRQPFHPRQASGGFLLVTVRPKAADKPPTALFTFYDEQGARLHDTLKTAQ